MWTSKKCSVQKINLSVITIVKHILEWFCKNLSRLLFKNHKETQYFGLLLASAAATFPKRKYKKRLHTKNRADFWSFLTFSVFEQTLVFRFHCGSHLLKKVGTWKLILLQVHTFIHWVCEKNAQGHENCTPLISSW